MTFWVILVACLVPVVIGVAATMVDESVAMHGGFHKKHL
jgi:hypothetical protein